MSGGWLGREGEGGERRGRGEEEKGERRGRGEEERRIIHMMQCTCHSAITQESEMSDSNIKVRMAHAYTFTIIIPENANTVWGA